MKRILNVCVTGAGGNIAYSLFGLLISGNVFGQLADVNLRLLDIEAKQNKLKALKVQLEDCCFANLKKIEVFKNDSQAFHDADVVIFLGGMSRKPGMERNQVFQINAKIFQQHGKNLNLVAKKTCMSLVVANPANTNCMVLALNAPSIPAENFTCLTRLDYNRLVSQITQTLNLDFKNVKNAIVWGNHSRNQFCDLNRVQLQDFNQKQTQQKLSQIDQQILAKNIADRGIFIVDNIGGGSFISAAKAIIDHLKDWFNGSDRMVSMGVIVKESIYGIPQNLCFSLPVNCLGGGKYTIIGDLELNLHQKKRIGECREQLLKQKQIVIESIPAIIKKQ